MARAQSDSMAASTAAAAPPPRGLTAGHDKRPAGLFDSDDRQLSRAMSHLLGVPGDAGLLADEGIGLVKELGGIGARLGQDAARQAIGLLQQRLHQVLRLHDLVAALRAQKTHSRYHPSLL